MPEVTVNIDVYCSECGAGLCNQTTANKRGRSDAFYVEPCQKCMEAARDEANREGYDRGAAEARS